MLIYNNLYNYVPQETNVQSWSNQFPFFSFSLVYDPASDNLTLQPLLRVWGHQRERPERQQISTICQFLRFRIFSGSYLVQILV